MRLAETVTFGGSGMDRCGMMRRDAAAMARLAADPAARVLPLWRGKPLVCRGDPPSGCWLVPGHPALAAAGEVPLFLGLDGAAPRYAVDLAGWQPAELPATLGAFADPSEQEHPLVPGACFAELRGLMSGLTPREAELIATARALTGWHATHRFCAACGAASVVAMAGWQRDCPACGAHHFPRTDPVVIMLITRGDHALIGRSPGWPDRMYSLLAGFVEPGETVEAAVRREVFEETRVRVGRVEYLASQPWPFPASLMLGCRGEALSSEIVLDPAELEAALWLSRAEVASALRGGHPLMRPPRPGAIAGFLLRHWVADRLD